MNESWIRVVVIDGQLWLLAVDVIRVLGLSDETGQQINGEEDVDGRAD